MIAGRLRRRSNGSEARLNLRLNSRLEEDLPNIAMQSMTYSYQNTVTK
jgi:hypothetical protein